MKKVLVLTLVMMVLLSGCAFPWEQTEVDLPSRAEILEVGYFSKVTLELPNAIAGDYHVVVGGVDWSCRSYEDYPDRLYCFGPELPPGSYALEIFAQGEEQPLLTLTLDVSGQPAAVAAAPTASEPPPAAPEPTATLEPTVEAVEPVLPSPTVQDVAMETPQSPPPMPTATQTPKLPPTIKPEDAIKVFYVDLNEKGSYGCGEQMYWVSTNVEPSGNVQNDISYALRQLFTYHNSYFGSLYNPYAPSNFAIGGIELLDDGGVAVYLTGTYVRSDDPCDASRLMDQIKRIITQFPLVSRAYIYLNGSTLKDILSR